MYPDGVSCCTPMAVGYEDASAIEEAVCSFAPSVSALAVGLCFC